MENEGEEDLMKKNEKKRRGREIIEEWTEEVQEIRYKRKEGKW